MGAAQRYIDTPCAKYENRMYLLGRTDVLSRAGARALH